jgi:hypothetical protein
MKIINTFFLLIIGSAVVSCTNSVNTNQQNDASDSLSTMEIPVEEGVVSEAGGGPEKVNLPNVFDDDAIMLSLENLFNQEEVSRYKNLEFMGFFYDSIANSYSLRKTIPSFVETGIVYDDGSKSFECGVVRKNSEACLFLFSNSYLSQGQKTCKNLLAKPHFFKADEHFNYTAQGQEYLLSASDYVVEPNGSQTHLDYQLILRAQTNTGKSTETLLSFIPWFDDGAVTVLFIGDLDGDAYPDFIIDNAHKYTGVSNSGILYLTRASAVKGMPKPISRQIQGSVEQPESSGELGC